MRAELMDTPARLMTDSILHIYLVKNDSRVTDRRTNKSIYNTVERLDCALALVVLSPRVRFS